MRQGKIEQAKQDTAVSEDALSKIRKLDAYLIEHFRVSFGNRILKQIREYVPIFRACGGTENGALDDIFAKKILRKLESQNPVYIRSAAAELQAYLVNLFGKGELPQSEAVLTALQRQS